MGRKVVGKMSKKTYGKKAISVVASVALVASLSIPIAALADPASKSGELLPVSDILMPQNGQPDKNEAVEPEVAKTVSNDTAQLDGQNTDNIAQDRAVAVQSQGANENQGESGVAPVADSAEPVAKIGSKTYSDLQAAFDAAANGETVTLVGDVDLAKTAVVTDKAITLDMAGKKIFNTKDLWDLSTNSWSLVSVRGTGALTITGEGTLQALKDDCYAVDVQDQTARVTIQNGTYVGNISAVYVTGGSVIINGGSFSIQQLNDNNVQDPYGLTLNCYDSSYKAGTATIEVNGGTFAHFDPANNRAEGSGTNLLGYGAQSTDNGNGTFTVSQSARVAEVDGVQYVSLADAIAKADGKTIKMLTDVNEGFSIPANTAVTLDLNGKTITTPTSAKVLGDLTVKDSTADAQPTVSADYKTVEYASGKIVCSGTVLRPYSGGKVTLESGTIESTGYVGIYAGDATTKTAGHIVVNGGYICAQEFGLGAIYDSTIDFNDGVISTKDNAAISGNGTTGQGGVTINVTGGTVISNIQSAGYIACGIYMPNTGNVTISGGTIRANNGAGLVMRAGTANITGGVLSATGTITGGVGDKKTALPCSAIVFDAGNPAYPGYASSDVVKVSEGTLTADAQVDAISLIADDSDANTSYQLSGGTYSSEPDSAYIVDGYMALPDGNDYVIAKKAGVSGNKETKTEGNVAVPSSDLNTQLSSDTIHALADTAAKSAESLKTDGKIADGIQVDDQNALKSVAKKAGEGDSIIVTLVVSAVPSDEVDTGISQMKSATETAEYLDLSVAMIVTVRDSNGEVKDSASSSVIETDDELEVTVQVDPTFIQGKSVRIARNHNGEVSFINPTDVNFDTGCITFKTNRFSSYAVLVSEACQVTFDTNGGTLVSGQTVAYGDKVTKPADPSRDGYAFAGWYNDEACTQAYDFNTNVAPGVASMTLYAKWTKNASPTPGSNPSGDNGGNGGLNGNDNHVNSAAGSNDGSGVASLAKTGDHVPMIALAVIVLGALAACACAFVMRRRNQH